MSAYRAGRALEYRAIEKLRKEGWLCIRSAASHSPIDIVAGKEGRVLFVQVKGARSRMPQSELEELRIWAEAFGAEAEVWQRLRAKHGFKRLKVREAAQSELR